MLINFGWDLIFHERIVPTFLMPFMNTNSNNQVSFFIDLGSKRWTGNDRGIIVQLCGKSTLRCSREGVPFTCRCTK